MQQPEREIDMPGSAERVPHGVPPQPHVASVLSNDELVSIINGSKASLAQGMPVLIVPSSDGRLAAVAVNGLQILVPTAAAVGTTTTTTTGGGEGEGEGEPADFLGWLFLMASLAASVSYTAALSPPGGVWGADDKANGYVAGNPVLRDKSPMRFVTFYYCNSTAFFSSLLIIAMLSSPRRGPVFHLFFKMAIAVCLMSLGGGYLAAVWIDIKTACYIISMFLFVLCQFGVVMLVKMHVLLKDRAIQR